ncbi:hypothetical protein [Laspinema olomoucense]|uniref:Uncharacterized protein n=1 Tax=Laspinema olomoucense D3b TaxID=2953688 RepID=A0ABT2N4V6_9CYAN|nr:hypothetical protein [Laspinema sp. D3b]MCT7977612.1 hypothetical protein [Laspinema sp. D3b]
METQWYLCKIDAYPEPEGNRLRKTDNLSVEHPDIFFSEISALLSNNLIEANQKGEGEWYVWLPIIPRPGDTLQFASWQVEVSKVILLTDWHSKTGIQKGTFVSAEIKIRDDVVTGLLDSQFSIETKGSTSHYKWENYTRRGNDLQYYAWELRHPEYCLENRQLDQKTYYCWHTRIRPVTGDFINVHNKRWQVKSVELASSNASVDGYLELLSCN